MTRSIYSPGSASKPWTLDELAPGHRIRYFSYARRALVRGFRAAGISSGDTVLFPAFICRDLLSAAAAVGAKTAFYDVDDALEPVGDPAGWPAAKAVLAVNYFGFPQPLEPFRAYAGRRRALLIEDNAHGLFSRDSDGTLLGTRTDMGLFSLRKTLPLANGAALAVARDANLDLGAQEPFRGAGAKFRLKRLFRFAAAGIGPSAALSLLEAFRSLKPSPAPDPEDERVLPDPAHPDSTLAAPLTLPDEASERERRRELYARCARLLEPTGLKPVFPSLPERAVPYAYPFRCPPEMIRAADRALSADGIRSLPWPDLPEATAARAPERYRDVRLAHFLW